LLPACVVQLTLSLPSFADRDGIVGSQRVVAAILTGDFAQGIVVVSPLAPDFDRKERSQALLGMAKSNSCTAITHCTSNLEEAFMHIREIL
jgi:hypothetical protein